MVLNDAPIDHLKDIMMTDQSLKPILYQDKSFDESIGKNMGQGDKKFKSSCVCRDSTPQTRALLDKIPSRAPTVKTVDAIIESILLQGGSSDNAITATVIRFVLWRKITLYVCAQARTNASDIFKDRSKEEITLMSKPQVTPTFQFSAFSFPGSRYDKLSSVQKRSCITQTPSFSPAMRDVAKRSLKRSRVVMERPLGWKVDSRVNDLELKMIFKPLKQRRELANDVYTFLQTPQRRPRLQLPKKKEVFVHPADAHVSGHVPFLPRVPSPNLNVLRVKTVCSLKSMSGQNIKEHLIQLKEEFKSKHFYLYEKFVIKLLDHPRNRKGLFNVPVDPVALNLPTYTSIILHPMDLGTVKNRIDCGYYVDVNNLIEDVRLVFLNAMRFNPEIHFIHQDAKTLLTIFDEFTFTQKEKAKNDMLKREHHNCKTCAGEVCSLCEQGCLEFDIPQMMCSGNCNETIKKNNVYYSTRDGTRVWCMKCYNKSTRSGGKYKQKQAQNLAPLDAQSQVILSTSISPPNEIDENVEGYRGLSNYKEPKLIDVKDQLIRKKFESGMEPWVKCILCSKWMHQVCAMFNPIENALNAKNDFICPKCILIESEESISVMGSHTITDSITSVSKQDGSSADSLESESFKIAKSIIQKTKRGAVYSADQLPRCPLSDFLGCHISSTLESMGESSVVESFTVRVVSNAEKKLMVPNLISEYFMSGSKVGLSMSYRKEVPYKSKAVYLFQKHHGVDVCVFAMYLQEFDSLESNDPNYRKVYVAYLDSVKYIHPARVRTVIYHDLLVGYLDYARRRGFLQAHIWSCPPQRSVSYVFWCRPVHQKTPGADHLRAWYDKMLKAAQKRGVVSTYSTFLEEYFKGKQKEVGKQVDSEEELNRWPSSCLPPLFDGDFWPSELYRIIQRRQAIFDKRKSKSSPLPGTILNQTAQPEKLLAKVPLREIYDYSIQSITKSAEKDLLVVNLAPLESSGGLDSKDPEPLNDSSRFVTTRHAFHQLCSYNHYQFDTLRRAKHSTMMILYHLFNPEMQQSHNFCDGCGYFISSSEFWRCGSCAEYALCDWCHLHLTHPHKLTFGSDLIDEALCS